MTAFNFDPQFYRRLICKNSEFGLPPSLNEVLKRAVDNFYNAFDYYPEFAGFAPGKVNIMGEHMEYNMGLQLQVVCI